MSTENSNVAGANEVEEEKEERPVQSSLNGNDSTTDTKAEETTATNSKGDTATKNEAPKVESAMKDNEEEHDASDLVAANPAAKQPDDYMTEETLAEEASDEGTTGTLGTNEEAEGVPEEDVVMNVDGDAAVEDGGDLLLATASSSPNPAKKPPRKKGTQRKHVLPMGAMGAKNSRRKRKTKPKGYPKRPLSAYNIFFKEARAKIVEEKGKKPFQDLVRLVADQWKDVQQDQKQGYEQLASQDLERYKQEVGEYEKEMVEKNRVEQEARERDEKEREEEKQRNLEEAERQLQQAAGSSGDMAAAALAGAGYHSLLFGSSAPDATTLAGHQALLARAGLFAPPSASSSDAGILAHLRGAGSGINLEASALDRLTSDELEAARRRLEGELRVIEEARARRLLQQHQGMFGGAAPGANPTLEAVYATRGLEAGAPEAASGGMSAFSDELRQRLLASSAAPSSDHLAQANEADLYQRLSQLQQPAQQNEAESSLESILARIAAGGMSYGGTGRLPAGWPASSHLGGNPYEEMQLRDQQLRREELLLASGGGLGGMDSAASLLYERLNGGLGTGAGALGLRLGGGLSGLFGAEPSYGGGGSGAPGFGLAAALGQRPPFLSGLGGQGGSNDNTSNLLGSLTDDELRDLAQHGRLPARLIGLNGGGGSQDSKEGTSAGQVEGQATTE